MTSQDSKQPKGTPRGALASTPRPRADTDSERDVDSSRAMALHVAAAGLDKKALNVEIIDVTDANGVTLPYFRTDDDGFAILRIGSAAAFVHGAVTYRIEYTQRNVVKSFADTDADEFYWDVNGTGWSQPFGTVSATVHLAGGIADTLTGKFACYQGYEGGTDRCDISQTGDTITAHASDLLPVRGVDFDSYLFNKLISL